jgi:hypothetical protein
MRRDGEGEGSCEPTNPCAYGQHGIELERFIKAPEAIGTNSEVRLDVSMARGKLALPLLLSLTGLGLALLDGFVGDTPDGGVSPSSTLAGGSRRTLANLRLAGTYSHSMPPASHLLQRGRSPEHLVFCEWHCRQALWALLRSVPASVWLCEGVVLDTLSRGRRVLVGSLMDLPVEESSTGQRELCNSPGREPVWAKGQVSSSLAQLVQGPFPGFPLHLTCEIWGGQVSLVKMESFQCGEMAR